MRISENTAVVVDNPRDMFRNGMQVLDGDGKMYEVLSVGIELLNDFASESNKTSLLIAGEFSSDKLYVSIDDSILQDTPFKPLSANDIFAELAESRACYERGEYEDFDDALNEISAKYFPEYEEKRKRKSRIFWEQCRNIMKYGNPEFFYFPNESIRNDNFFPT
jgi:hypothetical protein